MFNVPESKNIKHRALVTGKNVFSSINPQTAQVHVILGITRLNHFSSPLPPLLENPLVLNNILPYAIILQLQHSGGVVRLGVF